MGNQHVDISSIIFQVTDLTRQEGGLNESDALDAGIGKVWLVEIPSLKGRYERWLPLAPCSSLTHILITKNMSLIEGNLGVIPRREVNQFKVVCSRRTNSPLVYQLHQWGVTILQAFPTTTCFTRYWGRFKCCGSPCPCGSPKMKKTVLQYTIYI